MKKVIVLGAGLIGRTIASDLSRRYAVTSADIQQSSLNLLNKADNIKTVQSDLSDSEELASLIAPFDLVIGAVPGFMGYAVLKTAITAGKNVTDISFFPEDPFELNTLAESKGVTAVVDCGVAPGLCNILAGFHNQKSPLSFYECLVGGLPQVREWPFEYKAVFSPSDVLEEYTRPARYVESGQLVVREALSDVELISFPETGTLESFNTDGLRSLAITLPHVNYMKEKTLRYPGHADLMRIFRECGFFSKQPKSIKGSEISPLEFTSALLFPQWKLKEGERDFTVMQVKLKNKEGHHTYFLYDTMDNYGVTSMARTTAYTCTAVADLILNGTFSRKGISPPEYAGADPDCFNRIISYLNERGVTLRKESIHQPVH
ncbi:MAG: saccharopine dehydrogenase NADP-binding domain-containing protein [Bacteroidia bacterium]|nr:saccharopine dehydrogenase NADP-binding domain-containing protein [Bacteroidia bacterium]